MTHRRHPAPSERTPEWLIGLLIAIVLVTAGWFFLRSVGAGDDPVLTDDGQTGAATEPAADAAIAQTGAGHQPAWGDGGAEYGGIAMYAIVSLDAGANTVEVHFGSPFQDHLPERLDEPLNS